MEVSMVTSGAMLKGASVYLCSPALSTLFFIHHSKEITVSPQGFWQLQFSFCKWDLQWIIWIILMRTDWLLSISELWMQGTLHLRLPAWLRKSEMQSSILQRLYGEVLYRSIPNTAYSQSSEQPVTLTTQFYHSSPLLPSLTAGIKCALNVYRCRVLLLISR